MNPSFSTDKFLQNESALGWWPTPGVSQYSTNFTPAAYGDKLFPLLGIDFPTNLSSAVGKRKAEFLAGRYCAKRTLATLGEIATTVPIGDNRSPVWPANIVGSISHSNTTAVAVASKNPAIVALGIDIEHSVREQLAWELKDQVLNPAEQHWLKCGQLAPAEVFTLIFSAKESLFKALYPSVNRYFGFDAATVVELDTNHYTVHLKLNSQLGQIWPCGTVIKAHYKELVTDTLATYVEIYSHELP